MYFIARLLGAAGLFVAATAHAQTPERALLSSILPGYGIAGTFSAAEAAGVHAAPILDVAGERALLGQVENGARPTEPFGSADAPIDGARALLGRWPSAISVGAGGTPRRSSFLAEAPASVTIAALSTPSRQVRAGTARGEVEQLPYCVALIRRDTSGAYVWAGAVHGEVIGQAAVELRFQSGQPGSRERLRWRPIGW